MEETKKIAKEYIAWIKKYNFKNPGMTVFNGWLQENYPDTNNDGELKKEVIRQFYGAKEKSSDTLTKKAMSNKKFKLNDTYVGEDIIVKYGKSNISGVGSLNQKRPLTPLKKHLQAKASKLSRSEAEDRVKKYFLDLQRKYKSDDKEVDEAAENVYNRNIDNMSSMTNFSEDYFEDIVDQLMMNSGNFDVSSEKKYYTAEEFKKMPYVEDAEENDGVIDVVVEKENLEKFGKSFDLTKTHDHQSIGDDMVVFSVYSDDRDMDVDYGLSEFEREIVGYATKKGAASLKTTALGGYEFSMIDKEAGWEWSGNEKNNSFLAFVHRLSAAMTPKDLIKRKSVKTLAKLYSEAKQKPSELKNLAYCMTGDVAKWYCMDKKKVSAAINKHALKIDLPKTFLQFYSDCRSK